MAGFSSATQLEADEVSPEAHLQFRHEKRLPSKETKKITRTCRFPIHCLRRMRYIHMPDRILAETAATCPATPRNVKRLKGRIGAG
jgi:hypothetical protein